MWSSMVVKGSIINTINGQWPKQGVATTWGTPMTIGQNLVVGHPDHHSDGWRMDPDDHILPVVAKIWLLM